MTKPLKIVHSNVCDPMRTTSMGSTRYLYLSLMIFQGRYMDCFDRFKALLEIQSEHKIKIFQMDVKTTFLNRILEMEIYMDQPEFFVQKEKKDLVCKLIKTLYRLKQSPRAWYQRINSFFINKDFGRSQMNHLLYVKQTSEYLLVTILYVDDLIIFASNIT